jgi:antitoxin component of MazEF toxin-antitoxin module
MNKTLSKHGNSLALVIDKPILEMLHITADMPLELTTNGDAILIRPIRDKRRQRQLQAALDKINEQFGDDLERLAQQHGRHRLSAAGRSSVRAPGSDLAVRG